MTSINRHQISLGELFPELGYRKKQINFGIFAESEGSVLIIGGAGSIGGEIAKLLCENTCWNVTVADSDESRLHNLEISIASERRKKLTTTVCDIRDEISILQVVKNQVWNLVIHAAALKHVPVLEKQPREAYLTNILGTRNVIQALSQCTFQRFVFVSSDKAANPKSVLGKTKLIGEYLTAGVSLQESNFVKKQGSVGVVRFGNVFLSRGSVIETFLSQIERGENLTVTAPNMSRYFMDLRDACSLTIEMGIDTFEGVRILKMGEPIRIIELARRLIGFTESNAEIEIIGTKPGEKFEEDLVAETENVVNTSDKYWNVAFEKRIHIDRIDKRIPTSDSEALDAIDKLLEIQ